MVKAIDVHIHVPRPADGEPSAREKAMDAYFRSQSRPKDAKELADKYRELDIFGVILSIDSESVDGERYIGNDYISDIVKEYPQQFIGFGSVDPWKGVMAVKETKRCARALGLRGMKFHPSTQEFYPNDPRFYPLWQACSDLGLAVLFHSGTTGVGAGEPGGGGIKLKYARPIPHMDDVAADFPNLTMIMAHPAFPWQDEQLAMLVHKPNVYMDISGWSPKYFSPLLIQYANTLLQDKILFGSDYPALTPERWLRDFESAPFSDVVRPKILLENAKRVLKLDL
ncbi:MAG: amidohydrolase family protein [Dehalococcoidia bacterium]